MIPTPTYLRTLDTKWKYRYKTMAGDWIDVRRKSNDGVIMINDIVKVIRSDIHAINGVLHKVNYVFSCSCLNDLMT